MRSFGTRSREMENIVLRNAFARDAARSSGAVWRSLRVLGWSLALGGAAFVGGAIVPQTPAIAQGSVNITFPQSGQAVRGAFKLLFEGIPDGGYAMIYLDLARSNKIDAFKSAVTGNSYEINTFPLTDGQHTVTVVGFNANGRRIGQAEVTFNVANTEVDTSAERVRLTNWTLGDRLASQTTRFKVFAESSADITGGTAGGMGGGAPGGFGGGAPGGMGGPGGGGGGVQSIPAPLDWQVDLLIRREVRDVRMVDGSANIKLNVKEAFHRQRENATAQGGMGGPGSPAPKKSSATALPGKAPWADWVPAPETGQYFVKMVTASGKEINGTRKAPTIPLGDLTPSFPDTPVQPGMSWESEMVLVTELSQREPIVVRGGMYFTAFENLQTPDGKLRRCARLESQFDLPESIAMRIAKTLQKSGGSGGQGGAPGGAPGGFPGAGGPGGAGATGAEGPEIAVARTNVRRIVWFDIAGRQVMRAEDYVNTYYEEEQQQQMGAGSPGGAPGFGGPPGFPGGFPGGPGGPGGAPAAPAEPTKVNYRLKVLKYLDDTLPSPTNTYNAGAGTAHSRDNVQDPPLSRVTGR
jgi:hypothetical protein